MLFSHRAPDGDTMPVNHRATNDVSDYTLLQLTNLVAPVFARLDVVNAHAHIDPEFDRFYVAGNMDLGAESDGVHVANEEMMVTFGPFRECFPLACSRVKATVRTGHASLMVIPGASRRC